MGEGARPSVPPHRSRLSALARFRLVYRGGMAELLTADEVTARLRDLPEWSGDTSGITRTVSLATFPAAISVVDRVAEVAEELNHHPDIDIRWRTLRFVCATHHAGGVTARDFELARRIDEILAASG